MSTVRQRTNVRRDEVRRRAAVRRLARIYGELETATARRAELWNELAHAPSNHTAAEVAKLSKVISSLWTEARTMRASIQHGTRELILARARTEAQLVPKDAA